MFGLPTNQLLFQHPILTPFSKALSAMTGTGPISTKLVTGNFNPIPNRVLLSVGLFGQRPKRFGPSKTSHASLITGPATS